MILSVNKQSNFILAFTCHSLQHNRLLELQVEDIYANSIFSYVGIDLRHAFVTEALFIKWNARIVIVHRWSLIVLSKSAAKFDAAIYLNWLSRRTIVWISIQQSSKILALKMNVGHTRYVVRVLSYSQYYDSICAVLWIYFTNQCPT